MKSFGLIFNFEDAYKILNQHIFTSSFVVIEAFLAFRVEYRKAAIQKIDVLVKTSIYLKQI